MVLADAALGHEIAVVLKHIEMIAGHDGFELMRSPFMSRRHAYVDGLAFVLFGLPIGSHIGNEPVANNRIVNVERAGFSRERGLCPIGP